METQKELNEIAAVVQYLCPDLGTTNRLPNSVGYFTLDNHFLVFMSNSDGIMVGYREDISSTRYDIFGTVEAILDKVTLWKLEKSD